MLIERVFLIGGTLTILLGGMIAIAELLAGSVGTYPAFLETAVLLIAFGVFFLYVGRGARRERVALLALGDPVQRPPPP
ncbi:MAG: hypothetical protein ACREDK_01825 [Thermoplasmata archaeon]